MKQAYKFGTSKTIVPHKGFKKRLRLLLLSIIIFIGASLWLFYDLRSANQNAPQPISKQTVKTVSFDNDVFNSPYFRFTDSGNWKLAEKESTANKTIFRKYLGKSDVVQHQLFVYVNSKPGVNELASPRVLPVDIKNDNSFNAFDVSKPCGEFYAPGELPKVKIKQIDGASLLCDPGTKSYKVIVAKKDGDYNLKLRREDGSVANYIVIYQDQRINPDSYVIDNIAGSFKAL